MSPRSRSLVQLGTAQLPDHVAVGIEPVAHGVRVRLHATAHITGLATRRFAVPAAFVPLELADVDGLQLLGFAFTQFALPVVATRALDFDFSPAPNLRSPPAVGVLLARTTDRCTLVAPLTSVHEQIVSVDKGELRWGWHGDLDEIAEGFETTLGVYDGATSGDVLLRWATDLGNGEPPAPRRRDTNPITSHLSYWTDNGAAYWYRTEPGRSIGDTVAEAVVGLRAGGVPVHAVELDSWFYPHEISRPIAEIGYPSDVPPTGMMRWEPRPDAFGADGIDGWADRLGRPPLVLHARHISPDSPYLAEGEWWTDLLAAQPHDPQFFRRWFDDAQRWGACCIEQDWMMMYWFGVRELRSAPGRARAWQEALDSHAGHTGLGLLWCMATPADLVLAASLPHVVAVRTSDDYRFADDPALLWTWYLTVNRLAGALGLAAFKDVFFSKVPPTGADSIDGDEHAELEALLSAMSAGPVGIGDRIGHTDRSIVMRTCDADGRIRHVDRPIALIDGCLFGEPARGERLAWATATSTRDGAAWTYVLAVNTSAAATDVADVLHLAEVGLDGSHHVYDWRARTTGTTDRIEQVLASRDWALFVCVPHGHSIAEGDPTKYVVVSSERP